MASTTGNQGRNENRQTEISGSTSHQSPRKGAPSVRGMIRISMMLSLTAGLLAFLLYAEYRCLASTGAGPCSGSGGAAPCIGGPCTSNNPLFPCVECVNGFWANKASGSDVPNTPCEKCNGSGQAVPRTASDITVSVSLGSTGPICLGSTMSANATVTGVPTGYTITWSGDGVPSNHTGPSVSAIPLTSGANKTLTATVCNVPGVSSGYTVAKVASASTSPSGVIPIGDAITLTATSDPSQQFPSGSPVWRIRKRGADGQWGDWQGSGSGASVNVSANATGQYQAKAVCGISEKITEEVVVVEVTHLAPGSGQFPKCVNEPLDRTHFNIETDPSGHQGLVNISGLSTATSGIKTAVATLGSSSKTTQYEIVGSENWIHVLGAGLPENPSPTTPSVSHQVDPMLHGVFDLSLGYVWYKTLVVYTGGFIWHQIGREMESQGTFVTNTSLKWGLHASVAGKATGSIAIVSASWETTIGGNWSMSTSIQNSTPAPAPYAWDITHFQEAIGLSRTVSIEQTTGTESEPTGEWSSHSIQGTTGSIALPMSGTTTFTKKTSKKCPL